MLKTEVAAEIDRLSGSGQAVSGDFASLEAGVRRAALSVAARVLENHLNADRSDATKPFLPCSCGHKARHAGRRKKRIESVLGPLHLWRAYYHCSACGSGFFPRDRMLDVEGTSSSPGLTRMIGQVGALVSFAEGSDLLQELAGVPVDAKQVERTAERLGQAIDSDERHVVVSAKPTAATMYLGMDGTGVPVRPSEVTGRTGKQPDGSAKTREMKLVTVWSAEDRDTDGTPVRDRGSISYSAAIESAATRDTDKEYSAFAQRVCREARRRGFEQAKRRVILGDGATWIWNLADEHFPGAIQIVDLFHVKGHLCDVAKAVYGADSDIGKQWAKQRRDELEAGKLDVVVRALEVHAEHNREARRCMGYLSTNRKRMRYPHFRAQGLCVSTGVVEAGCKVTVGTRMKRAGMRWTVAGADAIAALRCCYLSGRLDGFWTRRAEQRQVAGAGSA